METSKPGLVSASEHINSTAAQTEKKMDIPAPLTAVYIHTVPALPPQPYPQLPAAAQEPGTFQLAMPSLYSKETLPFLTLHIAGGLQSQPGMSLAAAAPAARPKSAGKHVCPHCGRDCMKPSVLEKHLRCHTGERPYPCTTCGVSFKTQSNLYKHKRTQAHARLSSESEQSSLGSVDNMSSSRETFTSSLSLAEDVTLPAADITCPANTAKVYSVKTETSVSEQNELAPAAHETESNETSKVTIEEGKQRMENEKPMPTASRHLPLKRQEATLFSKLWESSASKGKSQSHESTDSGFSESSDHYSNPCSVLPDHSIDSLTNSTKELDETPLEPGESGQESKDTVKEQEQKTLEERISKLISENTAVVEDKKLENVRPRKTVLSKQGSIDLPMPYTYKDSFHFDMRMSKILNVPCQRNKKSGFYSSVPTQHSTTTEHAPLTRSNSLPFSVTLLQPERSSSTSSYQSDYVTLVRRGSYGQINSAGFGIKPVNQQSSTHRPLVRQTAVDCNHATDGLFMNSSVEEACTASLSCDGDGGDICGEPSNRKFRRKKTQKFAYNKWYMYGGGTFKKLYNAEKDGDESVIKGRKCSTNPEQDVSQGLQKSLPAAHKEAVTTTGPTINLTSSSATACHASCPPAKLSLVSAVDFNWKTNQVYTSCNSFKTPHQRNLSMSVLPLPSIESLASHKTESMCRAEEGRSINDEKHTDSSFQVFGVHIPSERKKQKTDDKRICCLEMETDPSTLTHISPSVTGSEPQQDTDVIYINLQNNQKHTQLKGALFPPCIINASTLSVGTCPATSSPFSAKTSFLPKYQLKLPNAAAEPDSDPSLHVVDRPTGTGGCTFTCHDHLSSSHTEQTSSSVTASVKTCSEPVTSLLVQSCEIKQTNAFISTQGQLLLPCTSSLTVVHRQFAAATITTTCLQDYQAGLCNTSVQPSKFAGGLPKPDAPMVTNVPATPTITTANNQSSAAGFTAFSHSQHNPNASPLVSHIKLSETSDQLYPVNSSNAPVVHCGIVPFDQMHTAAQNVFHVHTADLQICLQIISDEQLALIEPKIEGQADSILSQQVASSHSDVEAVAPGVIQNKAQNSVTLGNRKEGRDHQQPGHQKELDQRHMEGASLTGCAAQTEPQTWGHEETPGQADSIHMPKQSQDTGATNHRCMVGLDDGGVAAEDKNRGIKRDAVPGQCCKAESNCRYTCSQDRTKPEGEDGKVQMDSFKTTWLSRQQLQHLSQTHSGLSEYPKKTQSTSNNFTLPAHSSQTSLFDSPPPRNICFSQQCWESSIIHNQQTNLRESNSSQHIKAEVQIKETQNFSQFESRHQQTQTFLHEDQNQDQNQTSIMTVSCCTKLTLGSDKSPSLSPDVKTLSSTHHNLSNNNVLNNNTVLPSKPFTYPEPDGYQDTKDKAANDMSQSSNSERSDISNKYQSFFLTGQHHDDYPAECLPGGVRPVQSCQDYTEDTSSSDDEGKLIIEL